jgi:hypothetical protein
LFNREQPHRRATATAATQRSATPQSLQHGLLHQARQRPGEPGGLLQARARSLQGLLRQSISSIRTSQGGGCGERARSRNHQIPQATLPVRLQATGMFKFMKDKPLI